MAIRYRLGESMGTMGVKSEGQFACEGIREKG
jgi:hypothetical protein